MNKTKFISKDITTIIILSFMHLLTDLICGYKIVGILGNKFFEMGIYIFFIYNFIAFCLQSVSGLIVDKYKIEKMYLLFSFLLLIFGVIINNWIASSILLGFGNQLFHVGGGKICTNISNNKSSHLGVFVSLGAVGLAIGSYLYTYSCILYISIILYVILLVVIILIYKNKKSIEKIYESKKNSFVDIFGIILLLLTVFFRSFLGKIVHFDFELDLKLLLLFPIFSAIGKFIGGFIRDKIGSLFTITFSLIFSFLLIILFSKNIVLLLIGVMLLNISMPITLFEINQSLKNHEGLNFGLLAMMLFPGAFIGLIYQYEFISYIVLFAIGISLSIFSIYFVNRKKI